MNCREIRELLHAAVDGELDKSSARAVQAHVEECAECSSQVESVRRLKRLIQVKARRSTPPAGLEDRIREAIAREESILGGGIPWTEHGGDREPVVGAAFRRRAWRLWGSMAAMLSIAVAAIVGSVWMFYDRPPLVHAQIVEQALKAHKDVVGGDPATIPLSFCDGRRACSDILKTYATLPAFDRRTVALRHISKEQFGSYPGAHLLYEGGGFKFSVFAMDSPKIVSGPAEKGGYLIEGLICCCKSGEEYSVLCYRLEDTYLCFVVNAGAESFYEELLADALKR